MTTGGWICLAAPLAGVVLIILGGSRTSRRTAGWLATLSVAVSFGGALWSFADMLGKDVPQRHASSTAYTWLTAGTSFQFPLNIYVDQISVWMMLIVSGIGMLIVLYSIGYMDGVDEERRYFAYMALFVFSMLLLVEAGNLLILLAGWGLVGLCSYLLIGFEHERPAAIAAAKKAFIMNAIGDATMALALFVLVWQTGTLDFPGVFERVQAGDLGGGGILVDLVALGLLGGAVAKSAQIPLHTWLPDAMEGPTPVSALIHAATMVTAGVYLIARTHVIFEAAPRVLDLAAGLGAVTLLVAGLIALVQTDIKKVIAYSTMSQIGYMFVGVGIGAYSTGLFHLMTHAFFKALLFLAAGVVIHALGGEQDMRRMGGMRRYLPKTFLAMLIGALSLSAIPPFSGFFSKDLILSSTIAAGGWWGYTLFVIGLIGSFLTGLYTFRLIFLVFGGEPSAYAREHIHTGHGEGPFSMMFAVTRARHWRARGRLAAGRGALARHHDVPEPGRRAARRGLGRRGDDRQRDLRRHGRARHRPRVGDLQCAPHPRALRELGPARARAQVLLRRGVPGRVLQAGRAARDGRPSLRRDPGHRRLAARPRPRGARGGRRRKRGADGHRPHLRARARRRRRDPPPRLRGRPMTTLLIFFPIGVGLLLWLVPFPGRTAASLALLAALVEVGIWILALQRFEFDKAGTQFAQQTNWSTDLGFSYHVGMYGFSLWLVGLTVVVGAASVAYAFWAGRERARAYFGLALFLTGSIVGVFTAQDLILFYVFFETMLIPLYVLIGVWGGPGRLGATIQFVIYTVAGSLLMLIAIIALGVTQGTFDLTQLGTSDSHVIFLGFVAAFAVKAPLFPFHGWLPSAYREAPPEVSAVLSGVVSKVAAYGLLRIAIPIFPGPAKDLQWLLLTMAIVTLLYGSLVAFRAPDVRGVIAYSSMAQMGLITLGIFALNDPGLNGSVLQMVNHGLVSATLFLLAGAVERRDVDRRLRVPRRDGEGAARCSRPC